MAVRIESQAEPIPGYRLIERLGGGGFGEVWKAEAPGGLFKAIKFVYGDLEGQDEEGARAEQELKSLSRVKTVHHPYILSLERYDIINGQLIIVMELADRTLWDRFKECRSEGLPGIPREELLRYLEETAEALDLMNQQYQLQHLDIKPQNLFLVYNHIKVADFGLVKDLEGMVASVTGGVTPVYAAPETFDGWISRHSDQYSLAIVYQELLTGHRPFSGTSVRQLVLQHLQEAPDLSSLPPQDQPAVARALAKNPNERYANCVDFMRALRGNAAAASPPPSPEVADDSPAPPVDEAGPSTGSRLTRPAFGNLVRPPLRPGTAADAPAAAGATAAAVPADLAEGVGTPPLTCQSTVAGLGRRPAAGAAADEVLLPALIVGLGAQGQAVLKQLRREMVEHFGVGPPLPHVRLLCLDTDPEAVQSALQGREAALRYNEMMLTRLQRPAHYLKALGARDSLDGWLTTRMLHRIGRRQSVDGVRALGRLAFVTNFPAIARRLESELKACSDPEAARQAKERTGLGVGLRPRVYVIAGLGGGTGSGMFLDLAYVVKQILKRHGFERPDLVGLFLLPGQTPSGKGAAEDAAALANAHAALAELKHFGDPRARFAARYGTGDVQLGSAPFAETGPPFRRCVLLPQGARPDGWSGADAGAVSAAIARAGHLLFTELCTPLGRLADEMRAKTFGAGRDDRLFYQASGSFRLVSCRPHLLARAARRVCRRLIQRWMSKDARPLRETIRPWVAERWTDLRLNTEELIGRLQEACERDLGQAPETMFANLLAPVQALTVAPKRGEKVGIPAAGEEPRFVAAVAEALDQAGALVGIPDECQPLKTHAVDDEAPPPAVLAALDQGGGGAGRRL
jgi:hypothetical protein